MRVTGWHTVLASLVCVVAVSPYRDRRRTADRSRSPSRRAGPAGGPRHGGDRLRAEARRGGQRTAHGRHRAAPGGVRAAAVPARLRTARQPPGWHRHSVRPVSRSPCARMRRATGMSRCRGRSAPEMTVPRVSPSRRPGPVRAPHRVRVRAPSLSRRRQGAVCLTSANPTPESTAGCAAVLVDGRSSASGWPVVSRLRGTWTVPVFAVSPGETAPLRAKLAAGGRAPTCRSPSRRSRAIPPLTRSSRHCPGATVRSTCCSAPMATRIPAAPAPTTTPQASPSSSRSPERWRRP